MRRLFSASGVPAGLAAVLLSFGAAPGTPADPAVAAHFYYMEDTLASQSLQANHGSMGLLSPVWFTVELNGELRSTVDAKMVKWAASRQLPLLPVIANRDFKPEAIQAVLAPQARDKFIGELLKAASEFKFRGFELDFEEVPSSLREPYAQFVTQVADALHRKGMQLGIAVPAPIGPGTPAQIAQPVWIQNSRAAAFDYARIGRAVDSMTLMSYDEYTAPDQPGPVAGIAWVEACVRKTLEWVPAQKLRLGLALYYRHWSGAKVTEGPFPVARVLAAKSGVKMSLNTAHQEMNFEYREGPVRHVVWCSDAAGLAKRLALVSKHKLGGYAAWRVGQEDPAVWGKVFHPLQRKAAGRL
jgi:spore germination protein YaaH